MALRLRYNAQSIVLPSGQLFIGRSPECHLVVDDPVASRRHAVITMGKSGAFVTDLASKAGVRVNGQLVAGAKRLEKGDTIAVASFRIQVEELQTDRIDDDTVDPRQRTTVTPPATPSEAARLRLRPTPPLGIPRVVEPIAAPETVDSDDDVGFLGRTMEAPRSARPSEVPRPPPSSPGRLHGPDSRPPSSRAGRPLSSLPLTPRSDDTEVPRITPLAPLPSFSRPGSGLAVMAGLAEKAFALGRTDDAERLLQRPLLDTMEGARRGEVDAPVAEQAASLAARLSISSGASRWFDYAVTLYSTRGEVVPAPVIDLLYSAAGKVKGVNKAAFRDYVAAMKSVASDAPARRFLMQRLEGLQRLLDLK